MGLGGRLETLDRNRLGRVQLLRLIRREPGRPVGLLDPQRHRDCVDQVGGIGPVGGIDRLSDDDPVPVHHSQVEGSAAKVALRSRHRRLVDEIHGGPDADCLSPHEVLEGSAVTAHDGHVLRRYRTLVEHRDHDGGADDKENDDRPDVENPTAHALSDLSGRHQTNRPR